MSLKAFVTDRPLPDAQDDARSSIVVSAVAVPSNPQNDEDVGGTVAVPLTSKTN